MAKSKKTKTKRKNKTERNWYKNWNDRDLTKAAREILENVFIPRGKKTAALAKAKKRLEKDWIRHAKKHNKKYDRRTARTYVSDHHAAYD